MTLLDVSLRLPEGNESHHVDWSLLNGENQDAFTWWETFSYDYDETPFTFVASNGAVVGAVVDGQYLTLDDVRDKYTAESDPEYYWVGLDAALDFFDRNESTYGHGAEGPMMNYFWPVANDGNGAEWANRLADLPLCAVEMPDGRMGLALTGGGMDLSWEIGAAYVALGYYPPTSLRLPAMAGLDVTSEPHRTVARALVAALRNEAERATRAADSTVQQYTEAFAN